MPKSAFEGWTAREIRTLGFDVEQAIPDSSVLVDGQFVDKPEAVLDFDVNFFREL